MALDIYTANVQQLMMLPNIGKKRATNIYRGVRDYTGSEPITAEMIARWADMPQAQVQRLIDEDRLACSAPPRVPPPVYSQVMSTSPERVGASVGMQQTIARPSTSLAWDHAATAPQPTALWKDGWATQVQQCKSIPHDFLPRCMNEMTENMNH